MTCRHQKRAVEITGQRFGRLVVLRRAGSDGNGRARWACRCDCGGNATYLRQVLIAGEAKSCGCLHIETARANLRPYTRPAPADASPCVLAQVWR